MRRPAADPMRGKLGRPTIRRPAGEKKSDTSRAWGWWQAFGLADDMARAFAEARTAGPDEAPAAVERARALTRDLLREVAENLDIPIGDPLMVETVAIALSVHALAFNTFAARRGAKAKRPALQAKLGALLLANVEAAKAGLKKSGRPATDDAALRHPLVKARLGGIGIEAAKKTLATQRRLNGTARRRSRTD